MITDPICSSDGFMEFVTDECVFNSTELKDIEYIRSSYYNKLEYTRFSSSVGKFVGFTEYGVRNAEYWNSDPSKLSAMRAQKEVYCLNHVPVYYSNVLTKSGESERHYYYHRYYYHIIINVITLLSHIDQIR